MSSTEINKNTNIGLVRGRNFSHVGGIAGYLGPLCNISTCVNAGIVVGSLQYVGGVVGYVDRDAIIH